MKNIRPLLLTLTLWISAMLAPNQATAGAGSYLVNFPPGYSTFANHLDTPTDIQTLFGTKTPPYGTTVYRFDQTSGYSIYAYEEDDFGVGGWSPNAPVLARGEGVFVRSPSSFGGINVIGSETPPDFLVSPPGFHIRGRQNIEKGTFESVIGSWPQDYATKVVYRHNPSGTGTSLGGIPGFFDVFAFANGRWSPSAPLLNVGEAAFFRILGPYTGTGIWPPPPSTFVVNGVSPSLARSGTAVTLNLTGYRFSTTDQVQLKKGGTIIPISGSYSPDPYGYFLTTPSFYLTANGTAGGTAVAPGYYHVQVKRGNGPWTTVLNKGIYIQPTGTAVSVKILGPTVTRPGGYAVYTLCVKNNDIFNPVTVDVTCTIPTGMIPDLSLDANTSSSGTGFTVTSYLLGPGIEHCFAFGLTPSSGLLGQTVDILGKVHLSGSTTLMDKVRIPILVVSSIDPNDKFGPSGFGSEHYVTGLDPFDYLVTFENKPTATAPAQVVEITDQLDTTKLNLSTYQIGPIAFGSKVVFPPSGLQNWTGDEPYDVDGNPLTLDDNILVRITASLDNNATSPTYGLAKWTFRSLESAPPHLPVQLANIGFLPPNDTAPEGQGSVSFSVTPFSNLASGDTVQNGASIVFDNNAAIITPVWVNTIDVDEPGSSVDSLPSSQSTASFPVSWSGTDPDSGIATYDVYVSDDNGPFTIWQTATTVTSATFNGLADHTYRFYSVATDNLGNVEEAPDAPETTPDAITKVQLPGPPLQITRVGNDVVLTWNNPAFRLETTFTPGSTAAWSPLAGSSPATVPIGPGHQFFRLVSP